MAIEITDKRKSPAAISMEFRQLPQFERSGPWLRIDWLYWMVDVSPWWLPLLVPVIGVLAWLI